MVTLWDVTGWTSARVLHDHRWIVYGVGWSPDGSRLASSGWDNAIRLWDPATGTCVQVLSDSDDPTYFFGVAWSPDGERLASGTYIDCGLVWEVTAHPHLWVGVEAPYLIPCLAWGLAGMRC